MVKTLMAIVAVGLIWPASSKAEDHIAAARAKVVSAVAGADLPKSTYDPNEPIRHSHRAELATPRIDPKMDDAIRNALSLSVSVCFNIYTQSPVVGQDARLERCVMRVISGYSIVKAMLTKEVASDSGR